MGTEKWLSYFPARIRLALERFGQKDKICEIRLRRNAPLSLTLFSGNVTIGEDGAPCPVRRGIKVTDEETRETVSLFCEGSVYRYSDTARDGFIVNGDGIRLGICYDKSAVFSPDGTLPDSLNFRIPRFVPGAARDLVRYFCEYGLSSALIVSLPGAGKTTLARDLALSLAGGKVGEPRRVAVIDERRELFPFGLGKESGLCDLISGKPKAEAIEIAVRVLNPEVVLCDEIGSADDAGALLTAQAGGCVFIATAHAATLETVRQKPHLNALVRAGLFETLVVLEREPGSLYASRLTFCRLP